MNDSIEELQIQVRELNERLRTWEVAAAEERERCVTRHIASSISLPTRQGRHQELTRIMDRVVEIGLRGGAWAELQNDTPLQAPRIQSNLISSAPYEHTHTERKANTVSSSNDT